jgi:hypothetical protein
MSINEDQQHPEPATRPLNPGESVVEREGRSIIVPAGQQDPYATSVIDRAMRERFGSGDDSLVDRHIASSNQDDSPVVKIDATVRFGREDQPRQPKQGDVDPNALLTLQRINDSLKTGFKDVSVYIDSRTEVEPPVVEVKSLPSTPPPRFLPSDVVYPAGALYLGEVPALRFKQEWAAHCEAAGLAELVQPTVDDVTAWIEKEMKAADTPSSGLVSWSNADPRANRQDQRRPSDNEPAAPRLGNRFGGSASTSREFGRS